MKKILKQKSGITLIALVITIIVLLILAGISISMLSGDNSILQKATDAKTQTEIGQEKEIIALAYNSALAKKVGNGDLAEITTEDLNNELDSSEANATGSTTITIQFKNGHTYIIKSNGEIEEKNSEKHNWLRNGDELTCVHCNKTVYIGKAVNYEASGNLETSIGADKSGFNEIQYFSDSSPVWVVLGIEDSDGDSKYETLLLTTEKPVISETLILRGAAAYNNYIAEANRMAKELYGDEARAMTIEDVNNCLQYEPVGARYYDNSYNSHIVDFNTPLRNLTDIWNETSGIGTTYLTPDGSVLGDNQLSDYSYHIGELTNSTEIEKNLIFGSQG